MTTRSGRELSPAAVSVWAKSPRRSEDWLPLWRHLDDSAAVAGHVWDNWLPAATRQLIAEPLPEGEMDARRLAVWLAGVHDIGKATPTFAAQVQVLCNRMRDQGLVVPHRVAPQDRKLALHATTGQVLLERWLETTYGWNRLQARPIAVVVGGHHGVPPADVDLRLARERRALLGLADDQQAWQLVQRELLDRAAAHHDVHRRLPYWQHVQLSQPAQVLLTALVIVADWIASNEDLFPYDPARLRSSSRLADAMAALDLPRPWRAVAVDGVPAAKLFASRFSLPAGASPYPVQAAAVDLAGAMPAPGLLIIEAPMGEGKTEAALAAAERLAARSGAGGVFVALPTRATSDAMFARVQDWLQRIPDADPQAGPLAVTLAHGKARFNEDFTMLMRTGRSAAVAQDDVDDSRTPGTASTRELAAHRWLMGRKKALLSSFVVGTIDQLLFGALKSRHLALRHLGLAGKVVIIDEAHAYDVYMSQYLDRALEWLAAYQVPTIVLSATLPAQRRKEMIQAYDRGRGLGASPARRPSWRGGTAAAANEAYGILDGDIGYPVLTSSGADGRPTVRMVDSSGRAVAVTVSAADDRPEALATMLRTELAEGGCALVVRNTVRRVQETAAHLRPALADAGIDVSVAHSRFLAPDRAEKDRWLRSSFGPPEQVAIAGGRRPDRHVVVASQVAEQSLDIDFDLLVTDLAPVDLVLQRAGRLHRHHRGDGQSGRPARLRTARCLVAGVDWSASPPEPDRGSIQVYGRYPLLRSLAVLQPFLNGERVLDLPADIAPLVQDAYGDREVGPDSWRGAIRAERTRHDERQQVKESRAKTFRLAGVRPPGEPIMGWLDANVGDVDDDPRLGGRKQVRDAGAENVEVLVVVWRGDGTLVTPPWLRRDGGRVVPSEHTPPDALARVVASCTLSLPYQLCQLDAIEELERRNDFPAWQQSPWLAGELVLVLDENGRADLHGFHLRYDPSDGLAVTSGTRSAAQPG